MATIVVIISWTLTVVIRQSLLKKIHRIQLTVLANLQLIAGKALKAFKSLFGHRFITKHLRPRKTPVKDS